MKSASLASAFFLSGALAAAAEEFGRIDATLDGETRAWYTIAMTQGSRTDASATVSTGGVTSDLHIQGHPRPSFTTSDVLSIDLMYRGNVQSGAEPMSVEVMYMPTGMKPPFWTSDKGASPASVSFDRLSLESGAGRASGTFSATLCIVENMTAEPDTTRCRPIEGRFDTQLLVEE